MEEAVLVISSDDEECWITDDSTELNSKESDVEDDKVYNDSKEPAFVKKETSVNNFLGDYGPYLEIEDEDLRKIQDKFEQLGRLSKHVTLTAEEEKAAVRDLKNLNDWLTDQNYNETSRNYEGKTIVRNVTDNGPRGCPPFPDDYSDIDALLLSDIETEEDEITVKKTVDSDTKDDVAVKKSYLKEEKPVVDRVFDSNSLSNLEFSETTLKDKEVNVASSSTCCRSTFERNLVIQNQEPVEYIKDICVTCPKKSSRQTKAKRSACKMKCSKMENKRTKDETSKQNSKEKGYNNGKSELYSYSKGGRKHLLDNSAENVVMKNPKWIVKKPQVSGGQSSLNEGKFQAVPVATSSVCRPAEYLAEDQLGGGGKGLSDENGNTICHDASKESGVAELEKDVHDKIGCRDIDVTGGEELVDTLNSFIESEYDGALVDVSWDKNVVKLFQDYY